MLEHGRLQTGSSITFIRILYKNAISGSKTMFSTVPDTMEHRPTSKTNWLYRKYNTTVGKPEVVTTLYIFCVSNRRHWFSLSVDIPLYRKPTETWF